MSWVPQKEIRRAARALYEARRGDRRPVLSAAEAGPRRIECAFGEGRWEGFSNRQYSAHNYSTGAEWIAWFEGWQAGQRERTAAARSELDQMRRLDAELRSQLANARISNGPAPSRRQADKKRSEPVPGLSTDKKPSPKVVSNKRKRCTLPPIQEWHIRRGRYLSETGKNR